MLVVGTESEAELTTELLPRAGTETDRDVVAAIGITDESEVGEGPAEEEAPRAT